jgi:deoxyribodipyrimidine photolyase-related protein
MKIFLILPTQLFRDIKNLNEYDKIYILEDPYYLNAKYHKQKLLLHLSSMYFYYDYLKDNKLNVEYVTYDKIDYLKILKSHNITMYDPIDKKMVNLFKKYNVNFLDSKLFLNTNLDLLKLKKQNNKYTQSEFYKYQRIKYNILMDNDKPVYNKWSFDTDNREKFLNNYKESRILIYNNKYIIEAGEYINKHFKYAFGTLATKGSYYPCNFIDAKKHLKHFINTDTGNGNKINNFGRFQDAISKNVIYGEHSNISALLNIGLLTPKEVIIEILKYYNNSKTKKQIINSIEGIIRQIIGWREYMHFIYFLNGEKTLRNFNKLDLTTKLPISWYKINGTELEIINMMIRKVYNYAYLHHIERLMVINNIMILYNFKLKDILNWFMTCFIDSYDWVMIPNVMMNINSIESNNTGDSIKYMTRVYLGSDNYIKKMSDFNNKQDFKILNNLYWKFLKKNKTILKSDYGLSAQISKLN